MPREASRGGVVRCLSHELDIAHWLFGMPRRVYATGGRLSSLDIDVEDTAAITLECDLGGRTVPIQVYLDFVQWPPRRFCEILSERGTVRRDYCRRSVARFDAGTGRWLVEVFSSFDRKSAFLGRDGPLFAMYRWDESSTRVT